MAYWWEPGQAESVYNVFSNLKHQSSQRIHATTFFYRMYQNADLMGLDPYNYYKVNLQSFFDNGPTINICKSLVDTAGSMIAANLPRPVISVIGGEPSFHRKAIKLNRLLFQQFKISDVYSTAQMCFRDACINGTGIFHSFVQDGEIKCERVFPTELFVDFAETRYTPPTQIFRHLVIPKEEAMARFPGHEQAIKDSPTYQDEYTLSERLVDMIEIVASWHLPSGKNTKDGKFVVSTPNAVLIDEEYTKPRFPFSFYKWNPATLGFYGEGILKDVIDLQIEINSCLLKIKDGLDNYAHPFIFTDVNSEINPNHMKFNFGNVIQYANTPPIISQASGFNPAIIDHLNWLIAKAYEITGVSQANSAGKKPAGIDAAVAMREVQDIAASRFQLKGQDWENFICDIAENMIDNFQEIYGENKEYKVNVKTFDFIGEVDYGELADMQPNQYKIGLLFPTSLLPTTLAAKKQAAKEYRDMGLIDNKVMREILQMPDIDAEEDIALASQDFIKSQIEAIMYDGQPEVPDEYSDIEYALNYSQLQYNKCRLKRFPVEVLEMLQTYVQSCIDLIKKKQMEAQAQQQAQQPAPNPSPNAQ